jgi:hypothetical protein
MPSTPLPLSRDSSDAKRMYNLYKALLEQTASLSFTSTEFRQAMSFGFGPDPHWALPCNIANTPRATPPPLLTYFAPSGITCTHCNLFFHEEHRCYSKDPRNMYRFPPNEGWPNGVIPAWYIRTYNKPKPAFNSIFKDKMSSDPRPSIPFQTQRHATSSSSTTSGSPSPPPPQRAPTCPPPPMILQPLPDATENFLTTLLTSTTLPVTVAQPVPSTSHLGVLPSPPGVFTFTPRTLLT